MCSIVCASTTKVVQIMTLGLPLPILRFGQIWSHGLLYRKKWKLLWKKWKLLFFGNYCSFRSQKLLKKFNSIFNEVERVSKVKVILWPWSKVTQISKLKLVFHRNSRAIWFQSSYESWSENGNESWVTWPTRPQCLYMIKTFKNLLLQRQ